LSQLQESQYEFFAD
ncbi:hypothetical protein PC113_g25679, partial [Phytophthora cactorum]